jgi:hypothetical protein
MLRDVYFLSRVILTVLIILAVIGAIKLKRPW